MKKRMLFGSVFAVLLLLSMPAIANVQTTEMYEKEQNELTDDGSDGPLCKCLEKILDWSIKYCDGDTVADYLWAILIHIPILLIWDVFCVDNELPFQTSTCTGF